MISTFVGREEELSLMEKEWEKDIGSLVIIYGRRRVGKTRLVLEFSKGKRGIFFMAEDTSSYIQINRLKEMIAAFYGDPFLRDLDIKDWGQLFGYLAQRPFEERMYLFIDEFSYLIKNDRSILSVMQRYWDTVFSSANICIILSGSLLGLMSDMVLSHSSPLYGRRSREILLEGLPFRDTAPFLPDMSMEDRLTVYMITAGVPEYLLKASEYTRVDQFLQNEFLSRFGYFYREPYYILSRDFRDMNTYFSILEAISHGRTRPGQIADFTGIASRGIYPYLENLIRLGFVQRQTPFPGTGKKGIYLIRDNVFDFWFNFVHNKKQLIEQGLADLDAGSLSRYCGKKFEQLVAKELIFSLLPGIRQAGRWWHKEEEIDLVAINDLQQTIFIECKWKSLSEKDAMRILHDLQNKAEVFQVEGPLFGLVAKKIQGKTKLQAAGYLVFDFECL